MCNVKSLADDVPLKDKNGKTHWIVAYSRHKISAYISFTAVSGVINLFPVEFDEEDVSRPHGEVDVLVGLDYAAFHPRMVYNNYHLVPYENIFGKCFGSIHPSLREETKRLISNTHVNHIMADDFFRYEAMVVKWEPRCCSDGKCKRTASSYTLKEQREISLIKNGLTLKDNI